MTEVASMPNDPEARLQSDTPERIGSPDKPEAPEKPDARGRGIRLSAEECERFAEPLLEVVSWLGGYTAAGGAKIAGLDDLRALHQRLKREAS